MNGDERSTASLANLSIISFPLLPVTVMFCTLPSLSITKETTVANLVSSMPGRQFISILFFTAFRYGLNLKSPGALICARGTGSAFNIAIKSGSTTSSTGLETVSCFGVGLGGSGVGVGGVGLGVGGLGVGVGAGVGCGAGGGGVGVGGGSTGVGGVGTLGCGAGGVGKETNSKVFGRSNFFGRTKSLPISGRPTSTIKWKIMEITSTFRKPVSPYPARSPYAVRVPSIKTRSSRPEPS